MTFDSLNLDSDYDKLEQNSVYMTLVPRLILIAPKFPLASKNPLPKPPFAPSPIGMGCFATRMSSFVPLNRLGRGYGQSGGAQIGV